MKDDDLKKLVPDIPKKKNDNLQQTIKKIPDTIRINSSPYLEMKKYEIASEAVSIVNSIVDIIKMKNGAEAEAYLIREKTKSIEEQTKAYIERIRAEGGERIERAKIINDLLKQCTEMMIKADMDQETKRELIKQIPFYINSAIGNSLL